jgi:hypothetical protein
MIIAASNDSEAPEVGPSCRVQVLVMNKVTRRGVKIPARAGPGYLRNGEVAHDRLCQAKAVASAIPVEIKAVCIIWGKLIAEASKSMTPAAGDIFAACEPRGG